MRSRLARRRVRLLLPVGAGVGLVAATPLTWQGLWMAVTAITDMPCGPCSAGDPLDGRRCQPPVRARLRTRRRGRPPDRRHRRGRPRAHEGDGVAGRLARTGSLTVRKPTRKHPFFCADGSGR